MKKLFSLLLVLVLLLCALPMAGAEDTPNTFAIGETSYSFTADASGTCWSYDADTLTLTLNGIGSTASDDDDMPGIDLSYAPLGFQLVIAPESINKITDLSLPYESPLSISGTGTLNVAWSISGDVIWNSGTLEADYIYSSVVVNGGTVQGNGRVYGDLTVNGGSVTLDGTKASDLVKVTGGTLTIGNLDTYALELHGGTVKAEYMSNCNGTSPSGMKYHMTGGSLILDNPDMENSRGVFLCVTNSAPLSQFRKVLQPMEGRWVDAKGDPLTLKFFGYDDDGNAVENPTFPSFNYFSNLYNSDGTIARYARFIPAEETCQHDGGTYYRKAYAYTDEGELSWHYLACVNCGADLDDTKEDHRYVSFGSEEYCICGHSNWSDQDNPVSEDAPELALRLWASGTSTLGYSPLDVDQNGSVTLQEIARLQFLAQGKEVPEAFTALGMSYKSSGQSLNTLSEQGAHADDWNSVKLYILDPVTFAPLTQPILVSNTP